MHYIINSRDSKSFTNKYIEQVKEKHICQLYVFATNMQRGHFQYIFYPLY